MAVLLAACLLTFLLTLAHAVGIVVFWLAAGTFGTQVLVQADEAFFRTLHLSLIVRLHSLLLLCVDIPTQVLFADINFSCSQTDYGNLVLLLL